MLNDSGLRLALYLSLSKTAVKLDIRRATIVGDLLATVITTFFGLNFMCLAYNLQGASRSGVESE